MWCSGLRSAGNVQTFEFDPKDPETLDRVVVEEVISMYHKGLVSTKIRTSLTKGT